MAAIMVRVTPVRSDSTSMDDSLHQATKIAGCTEIIGIDRIASRLELATEVDATAVIDSSLPGPHLKAKVRELT